MFSSTVSIPQRKYTCITTYTYNGDDRSFCYVFLGILGTNFVFLYMPNFGELCWMLGSAADAAVKYTQDHGNENPKVMQYISYIGLENLNIYT